MRPRFIAIIVAIIISIPAICLGKPQQTPAKAPNTLIYVAKLVSPYGNMGSRTLYMKGSSFKWVSEGAGMTMTFIKNNDGAFLLHPKKNLAGKYPPGSNRESPMVFLPGPVGDVKTFLSHENAKKAGSEKVGKKPCFIYTYKETVSGWNCKLWVDQKGYMPVKMLMTMDGKKDQKVNVTYVSYQLGASVPDSTFVLPKDITIRPMPDPRAELAAAKKKPISLKTGTTPSATKP